MARFDLHQHLWPAAFVEALRARHEPPLLSGWRLELAEGSFELDPDDHDLERRLELLDRDEIDVAVVSLQPTLGLDRLSHDELAAWDEGILELAEASGGRVRAFSAGPFRPPFAGRCLPAGALLRLDELAPTLDELERESAVLFVHPGPAAPPPGAPPWWAAVVDYTAQMQAAYALWLARGRERWPRLRVLFAILAGGAPFQLERLRAQGVEMRATISSSIFLDTASYGARALELCLGMFGIEALVYGSDRPVLDAAPTLDAVQSFGQAVTDKLCTDNPLRLLG